MFRATTMASSLALTLSMAAPAAAQVATEGMNEMMQRPPNEVTCAEVAAMDSAVVPGTLYFIAGFAEGQDAAATGDMQTGDAETGGDAAGAGEAPRIARVSGYFEIPVERVMQVCSGVPDRAVSDVVREERDAAGAGAGSASDTGMSGSEGSGSGSGSGESGSGGSGSGGDSGSGTEGTSGGGSATD